MCLCFQGSYWKKTRRVQDWLSSRYQCALSSSKKSILCRLWQQSQCECRVVDPCLVQIVLVRIYHCNWFNYSYSYLTHNSDLSTLFIRICCEIYFINKHILFHKQTYFVSLQTLWLLANVFLNYWTEIDHIWKYLINGYNKTLLWGSSWQ